MSSCVYMGRVRGHLGNSSYSLGVMTLHTENGHCVLRPRYVSWTWKNETLPVSQRSPRATGEKRYTILLLSRGKSHGGNNQGARHTWRKRCLTLASVTRRLLSQQKQEKGDGPTGSYQEARCNGFALASLEHVLPAHYTNRQ